MSCCLKLKIAVMRRLWCLVLVIVLSDCHSPYHTLFGEVGLVSHPASLENLRKGDLAAAAQLLEARLVAAPNEAELSYTLGSVYLAQSEEVEHRRDKQSLQSRGWRLVEAASGRCYSADALLAHACLVGRWGKKPSHSLYRRHLGLCLRTDGRPGATPPHDMGSRVWAWLGPA